LPAQGKPASEPQEINFINSSIGAGCPAILFPNNKGRIPAGILLQLSGKNLKKGQKLH
jgi:hypothetical protein